MSDNVKLYCQDATEIFLDPASVDMFFLNPSYWGSKMTEYGGPVDDHINNSDTVDGYLKLLMKLVHHADHALKPGGSIFLMLQNRHNIVPQLCGLVASETDLVVGQLHVWDFSMTPIVQGLHYEKMGLIIHLHKGEFYVDEEQHEYVINEDLDLTSLARFRTIGFVDNNLPEELYNKFIRAFSREGDTIADIVGGTGTIVSCGIKLGRKVIYNDLSPDQYAITVARIEALED